jgi:hypothetical protein
MKAANGLPSGNKRATVDGTDEPQARDFDVDDSIHALYLAVGGVCQN